MRTGIRELRDNLSRYIRKAEEGERVQVTAHGRIVAELGPSASSRPRHAEELERLVASGVITPPVEAGDPLANCPNIQLAPGSAKALIDDDREER